MDETGSEQSRADLHRIFQSIRWARITTQLEHRLVVLRQMHIWRMSPAELAAENLPRRSKFSFELLSKCRALYSQEAFRAVADEPETLEQTGQLRDSPVEDEAREKRAQSESPTPRNDIASLETVMQGRELQPHSQPGLVDHGPISRPERCPYKQRQVNCQASTSKITSSRYPVQEAELQPDRPGPAAQGSRSNLGRWKGKGPQIAWQPLAAEFIPSVHPIQETELEPAQPEPVYQDPSSSSRIYKGNERHAEWQPLTSEVAHSGYEGRVAELRLTAQPGSSDYGWSFRLSESKDKQRQIDSQQLDNTGATAFQDLMQEINTRPYYCPTVAEPRRDESLSERDRREQVERAISDHNARRHKCENQPRYIYRESLNGDPKLRMGCVEHSMIMGVRIQNHVCKEEPCWSPACSVEVRPCRFANQFYQFSDPDGADSNPCHWGWGKMLLEHAELFGKDSALTADINEIMAKYRWRRQNEQRFCVEAVDDDSMQEPSKCCVKAEHASPEYRRMQLQEQQKQLQLQLQQQQQQQQQHFQQNDPQDEQEHGQQRQNRQQNIQDKPQQQQQQRRSG